MRGTKRKRDIFTVVKSVDNWFVASESVEPPPESNEGVIGRYGANQSVHDHANTVGEESNQPSLNRVIPVSSHVTEGPNQWLGLRHATLDQLDGTGPRSIQAQTNPPNPASYYVVGPVIGEEGVGPVPLGVGYAYQGNIGNDQLSLASEATNWLEARNPLTRGTDRTVPDPVVGIDGPVAPTGGSAIEERDLTPEDFWSLLRDVGYEVW